MKPMMDLHSESLLLVLRGPCSERGTGQSEGMPSFLLAQKPRQGLQLEVTLAVEGAGEGHVAQGSSGNPGHPPGCHSSDAVLGLLGWELPPQLLGGDVVLGRRGIEGPQVLFPAQPASPSVPGTHLVSRQDLEGGHDLLSCIRLGCFSGHEVNESLEGHDPGCIGVHYGHDASKLHFPL